ncbi:PEP/pyruvate-binding domain-containing protein [Pedobacter steynii]
MDYIKKFSEIDSNDLAEVGEKNAAIGEMFSHLRTKGVLIPNGFALTAAAYTYFVSCNHLETALAELMKKLDRKEYVNLSEIGKQARNLLMAGRMTNELGMSIIGAYDAMFEDGIQEVAVRSSATSAHLPEVSFAGLHESYLNIRGSYALLYAVKQCFASLYTDRAIKYREEHGIDHDKVFLSVGVQEMIRSDIGCSGIGFTPEPESAFPDVLHISGIWGLGVDAVQAKLNPDEFLVSKSALEQGSTAILQKNLGSKAQMMVYADESDEVNSTMCTTTP